MKVLLAMVVALGAMACAQVPQQTPAQTADDKPVYGGRLNLRVTVDPHIWDVTKGAKQTPNDDGLAHAYNTLLTFKRGADIPYPDQILAPELAERWEMSPDGKTFTFNIQKGIKYANLPPVNGREFTAADVKWSVEYMTRTGEFKDKKLPRAELDWMYEGLESVQTPDAHTVTVRFKEPFVPFLNYAASEWNPMLPKEIFDQDGSLENRIVGTGPYQLDTAASQKGTRWVWKKNSTYFMEGKPYVDEIWWLVLPNDATAFAALQTKQVDVLDALAYHEVSDVIKGNPQIMNYEYLQPRGGHLYVSQAKAGGPLTDVRVRKALSLAIDRDEFMKVVSGGKGTWAMPGAVPGTFTEAEMKLLLKTDVEEAKRLLAQAGYGSGLNLDWPVVQDEADITSIQLVQAMLKRVGVNAEIKMLEKNTQREMRRTGNFDLDIGLGAGQFEADPDSGVYAVYHSTSAGNYGKVKDPELDRLLEAQRRETNREKRRELLRSVSKRLLEQEWYPSIAYLPKYDVWQPYVKNYHPHWSVRELNNYVWLQK